MINFDFLEPGKVYVMEVIKDGVNADKTAVDYKRERKRGIRRGDSVAIEMVSGGGWIAKLEEE